MPPLLARSVLAARVDLRRALEGFDDATGAERPVGLNEVAWMVAHLADQEQRYWLSSFARPTVRSEVEPYRRARPDPVMTFTRALEAWHDVAAATEGVLEDLEEQDLARLAPDQRYGPPESIGVLCLRVFGHYYLHIGQITAVRRALGMEVPTFVGALPTLEPTA